MSIEEHTLYFQGFRVRLSYHEDGKIDMLRFERNVTLEPNTGTEIIIRSKSDPRAPEKIYELLRECQIEWN